MAIKTKTAAAEPEESAVASMNPEDMIQGGLADDFDGRCIKARFVPWDYEGNLDHYILAVALTVQPDGEEPFVQHYSAGDLDAFVPSKDGKTPVDLESWDPKGDAGTGPVEGVYAFKVGSKPQLNNNTNWAQFVMALLDAQFDRSQLNPALTFLEGVYGHWNRVPQKKRSGIVVQPQAGQQQKRRSNDILVITELKEAPAAGASAKKAAATVGGKSAAAKPATAAAKTASTNGGIDDRLVELVREALAGADEGLPKQKLPGLAVKAFDGADKAKAVKRVVEADFLAAHDDVWVYDADSNTLIGV